MIAGGMHRMRGAVKLRQTSGKTRGAKRPLRPVKSVKPIPVTGKMLRHVKLMCAEDVDAKTFRCRKGVVSARGYSGRPQDQRRVQRDR